MSKHRVQPCFNWKPTERRHGFQSLALKMLEGRQRLEMFASLLFRRNIHNKLGVFSTVLFFQTPQICTT